MKTQFEILKKVSEVLDLDMFYDVDLTSSSINLQGVYKSNTVDILKRLDLVFIISDTSSYIESEKRIIEMPSIVKEGDDITDLMTFKLKITLT